MTPEEQAKKKKDNWDYIELKATAQQRKQLAK